MGKAVYCHRACPCCGKDISVAGAAYAAHMRMHVRKADAIPYQGDYKILRRVPPPTYFQSVQQVASGILALALVDHGDAVPDGRYEVSSRHDGVRWVAAIVPHLIEMGVLIEVTCTPRKVRQAYYVEVDVDAATRATKRFQVRLFAVRTTEDLPKVVAQVRRALAHGYAAMITRAMKETKTNEKA